MAFMVNNNLATLVLKACSFSRRLSLASNRNHVGKFATINLSCQNVKFNTSCHIFLETKNEEGPSFAEISWTTNILGRKKIIARRYSWTQTALTLNYSAVNPRA
jgi:hypothetical protein